MTWRNHAHRAKDHRFHNRITQRGRVNPCQLGGGRDGRSGVHHYRSCHRDSQRLLSQLSGSAARPNALSLSCAICRRPIRIAVRRGTVITLITNECRGRSPVMGSGQAVTSGISHHCRLSSHSRISVAALDIPCDRRCRERRDAAYQRQPRVSGSPVSAAGSRTSRVGHPAGPPGRSPHQRPDQAIAISLTSRDPGDPLPRVAWRRAAAPRRRRPS